MSKQKTAFYFRITAASVCSLFSLSFFGRNGLENRQINGIRETLDALRKVFAVRDGMSVALIFSGIFLFYYWYDRNHVKPPKKAYLIAAVIGLIDVLGKNILLNDGLYYYSESVWFPLLMSAICFFGILFLAARVYELFMGSMTKYAAGSTSAYPGLIPDRFFNKHAFLYPAAFILICWLPYIFAVYPGYVHVDAKKALEQFYGQQQWTTHFPPLGVIIMGKIMEIGEKAGSGRIGCTLYVIPQTVLFLASLSYLFVLFRKWQTPYIIRIIVCLFDGLFPYFPAYAMMEIKDTLYYIVFLWLFYSIISILEPGLGELSVKFRSSFKTIFSLAFPVVLLCLLRNEAKYVILLLVFIALLSGKNLEKRRMILILSAILLLSIALSALINMGLCKYYRIEKGSMREALSIPMQQTARYIHDHEREISADEWRDLKTIFPAARKLGYYYTPHCSDSVKESMRKDPEKYLGTYFRVWFTQLLKHPGTYLEAALCQMYGYIYADVPEKYKNLFSVSTADELFYGDMINPGPTALRKLLDGIFALFSNLPLIKMLYHPACYTWITLFAYLFLRRNGIKGSSVLFALPLGVFIICCLSPANGAIRYSMPIILFSVIVWPYAIHMIPKSKNLSQYQTKN